MHYRPGRRSALLWFGVVVSNIKIQRMGAGIRNKGLSALPTADLGVRRVQPLWPFVAFRTLIGGSAHQTRNDSDLSELLVIASDLTGASCLPPAFRRPKTVV